MRNSDSPYVADWFVVSLRWLVFTGAIISLALGESLFSIQNISLIILFAWNISVTLLTGLNVRMPFHRQISLGIDLLIIIFYFLTSGGYASPAWWLGILPIFTAALYFEWRGTLLVVPLVVITHTLYTVLVASMPISLLFPAGSAVIFCLMGALYGFLGTQLIRKNVQYRELRQENQRERQRVENERMRAVYSLTSTLTSTLNYQRVLESVLDLSLSAVNTEAESGTDNQMVSVVMLFSKDAALEVASARGLVQSDNRATLRGQAGAVGKAIDSDKSVLLRNVKNDPELNRFVTFLACREIYCFPLRSGLNAYGVLLFGHPRQGYFTPERCETLDILGHQAVIAIQNARLYQELVNERDRMIDVQEEARRKLARDLHDGPTQSVSAIAMRINIIQRMLEKDPKAAATELSRIEDLAKRTTKEIRHMLFTLRPLILESQGLVAALNSMADKVKETYSQHVEIQVNENLIQNMELGKQSVIFYLVEEAVTNARKHAKAANIWVRLTLLEKDIALLEIQDDGAGFDVAVVTRTYAQRGSLGMINLQERTEMIDGVLNILSTPEKGTRVQVYIPLTEEAADRLHRSAKK